MPDGSGRPGWVFQFRAQALVLVPLPAEPRPSGLLVVDRPAAGRFHEPELRTLEAVAGYAGVAVDNARLYAASLGALVRRSAPAALDEQA